MADEEIEVDATVVFNKKLKLRTTSGALFNGVLRVFECDNPYCLIFNIDTERQHSLRMDVFREDLARELRLWLNGKIVRNPALIVPQRIEESISMFVRFNTTPMQSDLILWILSRAEIAFGSKPRLSFGSYDDSLIKPATVAHSLDAGSRSWTGQIDPEALEYHTQFPRTAEEARKTGLRRGEGFSDGDNGRGRTGEQRLSSSSVMEGVRDDLGNSAAGGGGGTRASRSGAMDDHLNTLQTTKRLLGSSIALSQLSKHEIKGRAGSGAVYDTKTWSSDHFRLVGDLENSRKIIEESMEARRKVIETSRARQQQTSAKYGKIRSKIQDNVSLNNWMSTATHELQTYQKIHKDIEIEILRQKSRAQRACQLTRWTIAPNGFVNRRGKSQRGPYFGEGPLPPEATTKLRDPRVEKTLRHFYWDTAGRRHERKAQTDEDKSNVEMAMEYIRKAASNISAYKLDLKAVFDRFDVSGDGRITANEMGSVFQMLGIQMNKETAKAVFKYFDPNGSGSINFGEFTWAFFNRRSLVRKWRRAVEGLSRAQIEERFHQADNNGDDKLNLKEFKKFLKIFQVEMSETEQEQLFQRFDSDGNGTLSLEEFVQFIKEEQEQYDFTSTYKPVEVDPAEKNWNSTVTYHVDIDEIAAEKKRREEEREREKKLAHSGSGKVVFPSSRPSSATPQPRPDRPSSAPVRRPSSRADDGRPRDEHRHRRTQQDNVDNENALGVYVDGDGDGDGDREVDVDWIAHALQAQAKVENRLGGSYYRKSLS